MDERDLKEKAKLADELIIADREKAKLAAELVIANRKLVFENKEKAKRAAELVIANRKLVFENQEKAKRAAELVIANKEKEKAVIRFKEITDKLSIYKIAFDFSSEACAITDREGKFIYINKAHEKLFGKTLEESKRSNYRDFYPPESIKILNSQVVPLLNKGKSWEGTLNAFNSDGKIFPLWEKADSVLDSRGKLLYAIGIMHDMTEKNMIEEDLRKKTLIIKEAGNIAGVAGWELEVPTMKMFFSEEAKIINDLDPAKELTLTQALNTIDAEYRPAFSVAVQKAIENGKSFDLEVPITTVKGRHIWLRTISTSVIEEGKTVKLRGSFQDITDRKKNEDELKESEEKFRIITEKSSAVMMLTSSDGKTVYISPTSLEVFGWPSKDLFGNFKNIFHPEDYKGVLKTFSEALKGKSVNNFRYRVIGKDKRIYWVSQSSNSTIENGRLKQIVSVITNIDEIKKAEEEIKENEGKFRSIFEFSPIGMYLYELDSKNDLIFRGANPSADKIIGINHINLIGKTIVQAFPGLKNTPIPRAYYNVALTGKSWHDSSVEYKEGEISGAYDVFVFRTSPRRIAVAFTDITERKKIEEELKKSKENVEKQIEERTAELNRQKTFLSSVLENVPNMIIVKDAKDLKFESFNKAGEELLGQKREKMIGKSDYDFFPKKQADFFTQKDRAVLKSGKLLDIPEEPINTKGGQRLLHTKKIPIMEDGKPKYLMGISEDITDRKKAETEYKTLIKTMMSGFVVLDDRSNIADANDAYCNMVGYSREQIMKMNLWDFDVKFSKEELKESFQKVLDSGSARFETQLKRKNGSVIDVELNVTFIKNHPNKIFAIVQDITERSTKDRELVARAEELERFNRIAIDRELKMVDLKKKIKQLEEALEKGK